MVFRRASGEIRRKGGPRPCRSEPTGRWGREAVTHVKGMRYMAPTQCPFRDGSHTFHNNLRHMHSKPRHLCFSRPFLFHLHLHVLFFTHQWNHLKRFSFFFPPFLGLLYLINFSGSYKIYYYYSSEKINDLACNVYSREELEMNVLNSMRSTRYVYINHM